MKRETCVHANMHTSERAQTQTHTHTCTHSLMKQGVWVIYQPKAQGLFTVKGGEAEIASTSIPTITSYPTEILSTHELPSVPSSLISSSSSPCPSSPLSSASGPFSLIANPDFLLRMPDGKYRLVDAKLSQKGVTPEIEVEMLEMLEILELLEWGR